MYVIGFVVILHAILNTYMSRLFGRSHDADNMRLPRRVYETVRAGGNGPTGPGVHLKPVYYLYPPLSPSRHFLRCGKSTEHVRDIISLSPCKAYGGKNP
jgi:hypothetical protein